MLPREMIIRPCVFGARKRGGEFAIACNSYGSGCMLPLSVGFGTDIFSQYQVHSRCHLKQEGLGPEPMGPMDWSPTWVELEVGLDDHVTDLQCLPVWVVVHPELAWR